MNLLDYFDRISIVHLPERKDRYSALAGELQRLAISLEHEKIFIPSAPRPLDANGFRSAGVHGNFLSHLDILKSAQAARLGSIWVMEDDAIFSRRFVRGQNLIAGVLANSEWDLCYFGHSLTTELNQLELGLPRYSGPFYWAHCYAVHGRVLSRIVGYLEETLVNPSGHPRGGRMYIDAAHTLFRKFNPDIVARVSNPVLSVQRGSPSSLAKQQWYDKLSITRWAVGAARLARDESWRWTGWTFGGAAPRKLDS